MPFAQLLLVPLAVMAMAGDPESPATAQRTPDGTTMAVRFENDLFGQTDHFYTNGFSISLALAGSPPTPLRQFWRLLQTDRIFKGLESYTFEVGQIIATPSDTTRTPPDPHDRPYAGILYIATGMQFQTRRRMDVVKFITGVLGPASMAKETQRTIHDLFGNTIPEGWEYQLENEPVLNFVYEHRRRFALFSTPRGFSSDIIALGGGMLGNILIQAEGGVSLRIGYHLPEDFGNSLIRGAGILPPTSQCCLATRQASPRFGIHLYGGVNGNMVARNVTLDGSTFRESMSVDRKPFFGGVEFGAAIVMRRLKVAFTYVIWTHEFENQSDPSRFGAIFLVFGL